MTVRQRSTTTVPGTDGKLSVTIDDITRGQVMISLLDETAVAIAGPVSVSADGSVPFSFGTTAYVLRLEELSNSLVGDDFATLVIDTANTADGTTGLTHAQKIQRLIAAVASLNDAMFLRNGSEHTAAEAADHLREKLAVAGNQVQTAEEFIEQIASRSSLTGREYQIRFDDGRTIPAGSFLRGELARIEQQQ